MRGCSRSWASATEYHWTPRVFGTLIDEKTRIFDTSIESGIESGDILYPGAAACVELMASRYPLGIASGALRHEIEAILRGARLDGHFRFIVASGDTPEGKPAPDPYRRAAALHGADPAQCIAIEDSRWGIESARAAGLACVAITTTYSREHLTAADRIVDVTRRVHAGSRRGCRSRTALESLPCRFPCTSTHARQKYPPNCRRR